MRRQATEPQLEDGGIYRMRWWAYVYCTELVSEVFSLTNIVLLEAQNLVTDLSVTIIRPVNLRLLRLS